MDINKLSIVIPCLQEEQNLNRFPEEVFKIFESFNFSTEYIFINDGSTDTTNEIVNEFKLKHEEVKLLIHEKTAGLGQSLIEGINMATGDAILTLDADLTFHPNEAVKLINAYGASIDCVLGSPLKGSLRGINLIRGCMSRIVNIIYRILLGQNISSTSSIFRLYRSEVIKPINLKSKQFQINAEILLKILALGGKVVEVPVTLTKRKYGYSKINTLREIGNHLKMFKQIMVLKNGK